jgi:hypothetical protein
MKNKILIILTVFIYQIVLSQSTDSTNLNIAFNDANLMIESYEKGDYDSFINFTHPKIINGIGGKDKFIAMLKKGLGTEFTIISNELSKPNKLIVDEHIYQCAFSQKQVFSYKGQKYYTLSTLIGISYDVGVNWFFISVTKNKLSDLKVHFPELSDKLQLYIQTNPILIKDE